ncbi:hypothetical protein CCMA1212_005804 [Trichoderma ghanense]|uniref:SSCRP protein n=1 Tax=Trichoderma ghanense TaxID=65468 RepID=A0ABY2H2Q1_9HYPO
MSAGQRHGEGEAYDGDDAVSPYTSLKSDMLPCVCVCSRTHKPRCDVFNKQHGSQRKLPSRLVSGADTNVTSRDYPNIKLMNRKDSTQQHIPGQSYGAASGRVGDGEAGRNKVTTCTGHEAEGGLGLACASPFCSSPYQPRSYTAAVLKQTD